VASEDYKTDYTEKYLEQDTLSGRVNNNVYYVELENGEKQRTYEFIIKAVTRGDNFFWSSKLSLTIECPSTLTLVW
jgi:hypothetical protein